MSALTPDEERDLCARVEALHGGADKVPPTVARLIGAVRGLAGEIERERLIGQLTVVRTERDESRARVDTMIRVNDEQHALYETVVAELDQARRDLEALRSALKPGALSPMVVARAEADLVVYKLEERIIAIVVDLVVNQRPPAIVVAHGLVPLVGELEAARAAAAKIGGGS